MIYFDNSATTLQKPPEVGEAVKYAINHFGNPSRSFNEAALLAAREIYKCREEIAKLVDLEDPLKVAFTSSATESINLIVNGLITSNDHVITTVFDHNAVLRPLYNSGCDISVISFDDEGHLDYAGIESLINDKTKALICSHASNVTGDIIDVDYLRNIANKYNLLLILDVSQSLGCTDVKASMADILCFTGHKSLFGPQGTGGIITNEELNMKHIVKTGGAGGNSFDHLHSLEMPDLFEVGTLNAHSIYGLQKGVSFVNMVGVEKIKEHKEKIVNYFIEEVNKIDGIKIYGDYTNDKRVGVVSLNYKDIDSNDLAEKLYEKKQIATRASFHCSPLIHEAYQTSKQGMVRFSFSYFNTLDEVKICLDTIKEIINEY